MGLLTVEVWDATGNRRQSVEMPDDAPVNRLMAVLLEKMKFPQVAPDGQPLSYKFHHRASGKQLLDDQTLAQVGVKDGDVLRLQPEITAGWQGTGREGPGRHGPALLMGEEKIQISWDELKTSKVEKHIRQQQAVARNRRYSQMTPDDLPVGQGSSSLLWYNPIFFLAAFGLLGGLLAWAGGAVIHLAPDRQGQADQSLVAIQDIRKLIRTSDGDGGITPAQANDAIRNIVANSGNNAYLAIDMDDSLSSHEKQQRLDALRQYDYSRNLITNILGFGLCGLFISIGLSVAEPVVDKNMHAVIVNGSVGAGLGLLGGLGASLVVDRIYRIIGGAEHGMLRQYVAQCASWAVLGSFVALSPGVVAKNRKRLYIGLAGGAVGGAMEGYCWSRCRNSRGARNLGGLQRCAASGRSPERRRGLSKTSAGPGG